MFRSVAIEFLHISQAAAGSGARNALRESAIILAPSAARANEEDIVWLFPKRWLGIAATHDAEEEGKGLIHAALGASVEHAFQRLKLHHVMANYRLGNTRSGSLLTRLGFLNEGVARRYLKIDGAWTDHVLTAKINDAA